MPFDFPQDIHNAIEQACRSAALAHYGSTFSHNSDDGAPEASLGRLSGGVQALGVYDDLIVGPGDDGQWAVCSDRGELLGSYADAKSLRAGLKEAINTLYPRRPWRSPLVPSLKYKKARRSLVTA